MRHVALCIAPLVASLLVAGGMAFAQVGGTGSDGRITKAVRTRIPKSTAIQDQAGPRRRSDPRRDRDLRGSRVLIFRDSAAQVDECLIGVHCGSCPTPTVMPGRASRGEGDSVPVPGSGALCSSFLTSLAISKQICSST